MKRTDANYDDFFAGILERVPATNAGEMSIPYEVLSHMMTEAIVVLDFHQKNFLYMPKNDLSLCGYTQEESIKMGYHFFREAIHPKDLSFWIDSHDVILKSLRNDSLLSNEVNYFSFQLQIKNSLATNRKNTKYLLINVKLKPHRHKEQLRYGVCLLSPSLMKEPDHTLRVHYINRDYCDYSFKTRKWIHHTFSPLGRRQLEMLVWAKQGLSIPEIADKMNISGKTIENMRRNLFEKWGVRSIDQVLQYASNHRLLYYSTP